MARMASALGVMVNVDRRVIFKSFYRKIKVLIVVRDVEKIPPNKLFEMEQCFFLVTFEVEKPAVDGITIDGDDDNNVDDDQQGGNEDATEEELGDTGGTKGATGMDTEMITPKARRGSSGNAKKACVASHEKEPVICSQKNRCWGNTWAKNHRIFWRLQGIQKRERHML
jgi:hypothetical protein